MQRPVDQAAEFFVGRWSAVLKVVLGLTGIVVAVLILSTLFGGDGFGLIEGADGDNAYPATFLLVALDAVIPIFPGETTLNAASTLASDGELELAPVIVAGALGAIVGDSALYWIARRSSARVEPQVERARRNAKVSSALDFLDRGAPVLLTFGRYVPGLRFVINATMGMTEYPYRKFLPWSALGAVIWSTYTCLLAYKVGSALDNFPMGSVIISGLITTILMAAAFLVLRRHDRSRPAQG